MKEWVIPSLLMLAVVGKVVSYGHKRHRELGQLEARLAEEMGQVQAECQQKLAEETEMRSGRRARKAHQEEWAKRLAHAPEFASTPREKTILEMGTIAGDQRTPNRQALEKVAGLASPKGAVVRVTPKGRGFAIDVEFDMAVMTYGEEGSRTKHTSIGSLKRETTEIISRVMKDLYGNCGRRRIREITVACKHGVNPSSFAMAFGGAAATKVIYKCSISSHRAIDIRDWRVVRLHRVADMLWVEHDEFPNLKITWGGPGFGW